MRKWKYPDCHVQKRQIILLLQVTVAPYYHKYSHKCLRSFKTPFAVHLWRAQSSYITKVEKKISDKSGFILAQRMAGWLFKNKPKMDFLHYSLWVPGLTVKLPSSKIIKSYLFSTDFQIGKHTWQYLVILPMSKVFKSRVQKAR